MDVNWAELAQWYAVYSAQDLMKKVAEKYSIEEIQVIASTLEKYKTMLPKNLVLIVQEAKARLEKNNENRN